MAGYMELMWLRDHPRTSSKSMGIEWMPGWRPSQNFPWKYWLQPEIRENPLGCLQFVCRMFRSRSSMYWWGSVSPGPAHQHSILVGPNLQMIAMVSGTGTLVNKETTSKLTSKSGDSEMSLIDDNRWAELSTAEVVLPVNGCKVSEIGLVCRWVSQWWRRWDEGVHLYGFLVSHIIWVV